ncbi:MAG TPA: PilZ domain-containing protein [Myxococcota bacterium]|nr:PilZ domain-containing protein [Myxococcota bacterium]HNZ03965.1 PilZ domain-containing protein [Myxococcota bacterium]HOD07703.1 PilZ domain-containing protein [Myxococcota bacterium]
MADDQIDTSSVMEIHVASFFEAIDHIAGLKAEALLPSGRNDPLLARRIKELEAYRDAFLQQVSRRRPNFHIQEQSKDPGAPVVATLSYSSGLELYEGLNLSLNRGGLFIKTEVLLPIDTVLDLTVVIEDIKISFHVSGKVIWINPRESAGRPIGIGIKFPKFSNDQRALLEEFMQGAAPTATLADLNEPS